MDVMYRQWLLLKLKGSVYNVNFTEAVEFIIDNIRMHIVPSSEAYLIHRTCRQKAVLPGSHSKVSPATFNGLMVTELSTY
jgi:hypothetical protein